MKDMNGASDEYPVGFFDLRRDFQGVSLCLVDSPFSSKEESEILGSWKRLKEGNPQLYSSPLLGVLPENSSNGKGVLKLEVYQTDYMHYVSTLDSHLRVWALGVSGLTRIHQGNETWYLFGERNGKNLDTGGTLENVPGGFMEPPHLVHPNPVISTYLDELKEEVGISTDRISDLTHFYMARIRQCPQGGRMYQDACIELIVDISDTSPEDVMQSFESDISKREHTKLHIVPKKELRKFVQKNEERLNLRASYTLSHYLKND